MNEGERRVPPRTKPHTPQEHEQMVEITIDLPPDLLKLITDAAAGRTDGAVLLEAFDNVDDDVLAAYFRQNPRASFSGTVAGTPPEGAATGSRRHLEVTVEQRRLIAAIAVELGAESPADLCVEVLRLHLTGHEGWNAEP